MSILKTILKDSSGILFTDFIQIIDITSVEDQTTYTHEAGWHQAATLQ